MRNRFGDVFGAVVAYILLLFYTVPVLALAWRLHACQGCEDVGFSEGTTFVVTTIGGLVSALVVSKLAITKPGDNPAIVRVTEAGGEMWARVSTTLVLIYLIAWVITGAAALVFGVMLYSGANETLSDIGTTWLGLAVAAGYVYFGLDPAS